MRDWDQQIQTILYKTGKQQTLTVQHKEIYIYMCVCIYWRRQWHPTPVLLPGKSHGWRSLVGCSPRGLEESDTTERLHFHISLSYIGEGNGNPPQCSCLENPRDGSLVGCRLWGCTESDTTEATQQQQQQQFLQNTPLFSCIGFMSSFRRLLWVSSV